MQKLIFSFLFSMYCLQLVNVNSPFGKKTDSTVSAPSKHYLKVYYGAASYYADKFEGRPTANGDVYDHKKPTAACNVLPLGTWIRVTNLANNRSVVVRINDRLHVKVKRIVDMSRSAAENLGYIKQGLTQVKVEVIEEMKKEEQ